MNKILIFSDVHWRTNSPLIRRRGYKYSQRLEHLIDSMNWVNKIATDNNCDAMICAGDFFDKAQCTDEEITALREIKWNDLECYFLCGNHESSVSDLRFSSLKALESDKHFVISDSRTFIKNGNTQIHFVPYVRESDRQNLEDYLDKEDDYTRHIVISHNEIQGINYGGFESQTGFSIKEIEENCSLYLNGHLHNAEWITDKILNVGSFSAHNFTNDSSRYTYGIWILDLETLKAEFIENPYGFNFYKIDIFKETDLAQLDKIKNNSVISIKTRPELLIKVKDKTEVLKDKIIEQKIITERQVTDATEVSIEDLQVDHLAKFVEFCKANISNDNILAAELAEICK